tara:strand:- start:317 stop:460 length:144 start_codon:yes stop_codon:yes gene_type:complete
MPSKKKIDISPKVIKHFESGVTNYIVLANMHKVTVKEIDLIIKKYKK